ncbi:ABC-F family ATP-binding cassette domain-containing protein [Actinophytocola algeriensis]|jgi:ATPase subunit of ABC transporter with duplicated ATPase domains|uniref:ATPase subunit of ABC transporter with duplicated ATPase domains n=1 Tax=Actinophytocola algeriensis TaxID=1768010 RepID=A0A7W7Q8R7_9PSEU|nr:ABC-F family ATP-binding cassette domain-containing protein [Actinophytocola algeriensis]MBB4909111.1 ATPase subunit of ABC transporter with duplicated ATPase domains [Actinophytocola algeriensis]MBE1474501.1 ATPase subunit of ABC transporter with duplicated ATPase domains [Actinophytocola algeriensis]
MITATDLELRAGTRILLSDATLRVQAGDRIGLVGRNGAGKTTSLRVLAGEGEPYAGDLRRSGEIGYLPQDPREGNLSVTAKDRVLSARGLDELLREMEKAQSAMSEHADDNSRDKAVRRYGRLEERFAALGGYAAESEAARICANLGLADRVLAQEVGTLSGGQRRRVELARILFAASESGSGGAGGSATTLLLDEPTNHLDADSINWLRGFLKGHNGGLVVISHDVDLLADVVNKVWFLDATRGEVDTYNMTWQRYLDARAADEKRRRRERVNAEKKAGALQAQADKMRAKATKAVAAQNMMKRAERLLSGLDEVRHADKVARIRFPEPAPCGKTPLQAEGLSKSYGSLEIFSGVDLAIDRGSRVVVLGLNGAGKTTLLRLLGGRESADSGEVVPGHGLRIGYYAQEHETLDHDASVWENVRHAAPDTPAQQLRSLLGTFLFTGEQLDQPAGTLSGGEKTRLALAGLVSSAANVLLLDEPTNNLDPASRERVLDALRGYTGAVVLVTHDPGAVEALEPERVILLPDGTEDHWSADYLELVQLA